MIGVGIGGSHDPSVDANGDHRGHTDSSEESPHPRGIVVIPEQLACFPGIDANLVLKGCHHFVLRENLVRNRLGRHAGLLNQIIACQHEFVAKVLVEIAGGNGPGGPADTDREIGIAHILPLLAGRGDAGDVSHLRRARHHLTERKNANGSENPPAGHAEANTVNGNRRHTNTNDNGAKRGDLAREIRNGKGKGANEHRVEADDPLLSQIAAIDGWHDLLTKPSDQRVGNTARIDPLFNEVRQDIEQLKKHEPEPGKRNREEEESWLKQPTKGLVEEPKRIRRRVPLGMFRLAEEQ